MKVLMLGGTGDVGQETARLLVASPEVDEVIVIGRTQARAEEVAAALGPKASGSAVDVRQHDRLVESASRAHVLVNTAGPDFEMQLPAIKAAIGAGVNYADIAADGRATDQVLALDDAVRARGKTALIGIGAAPGLTNLLAVHALRQLDVVSDIHFGYVWGGPAYWRDAGATAAAWRASGHVNASWQTLMAFIRGPVQIYREGQSRTVEPFTHGVTVTWPSGESRQAYPVDSAETRTLPVHLPGVAAITSLVCFLPSQLNQLWKEQSGRMISGSVDPAEATIALHEAVAAAPEQWLAQTGPRPDPLLWVVARGISAGRPARYACWPRMAWLSTAAPLATATLALLRGEVQVTGVVPPEAAFEPSAFFTAAARYAGIDASQEPLYEESLEFEDDAAR